MAILAALTAAAPAGATPDSVAHDPAIRVHAQATEVMMREPDSPREGEPVTVWARVGYSFYWDRAALYYTTDGSTPQGAMGTASGPSTAVDMVWACSEPSSPTNLDWIRAAIPGSAHVYGTTIKYAIGVWHSGGGIEVFANNSGCADDACDTPANAPTVFSYTVKMPWPGGGPGSPPDANSPSVRFWKEEAVVGNNYMNVQLDQNGTVYDIYFPSVGCTQGISAKNEGYADGYDTFPPGLKADSRGQMNMDQAQAGLRIGGTTYWLSNESGAYERHTQAYVPDTNVVQTSCRLAAPEAAIVIDQYDFCPKGVSYPNDTAGNPVRGVYVKRYLLTNIGENAQVMDFYYHADFAINGGDAFDGALADAARGAIIGYDATQRLASYSDPARGIAPEYNPTTFNDYLKNVAVYLGVALKACNSVGAAAGTPATDFGIDNGSSGARGWVGIRITLAAGETRELDVAIVGGARNTSEASDTLAGVIAPAIDWFHATSMSSIQVSTESYWTNWLASGTTISTPDADYNALFNRGLLATALHCDAAGGGIIAGMHNGAYPFVRPRDALHAAVTLDRTGHTSEAGEVFRFLRDVACRAADKWGKGFWYQRYTTDGYQIRTSPHLDGTANVPWAGYYHYLTTGSMAFLNNYYAMFVEAGRAMSEDSTIDPHLSFDTPSKLMQGNSVWEEHRSDFLYSNAAVERGLRDAARIAAATNHAPDAAMFSSRAATIHEGLNGRLDWDGENTDISQIALVWPFETHTAIDQRLSHVMDRINAAANDRFGSIRGLVHETGEFQGLFDRYWGDTYWNGGPWFLSTLWYGQFYAKRQDCTAGKGDIDNFKSRIDLTRAFLGPAGLGAQQMAPGESLLVPEQNDFRLQAAWPNTWESMSTYVDCLMLFLDHRPDAPANTIRLAPKLPTGWNTLTYRNLKVGSRVLDVTCTETSTKNTHAIKNVGGGAMSYDTYVRLPAVAVLTSVKQNGTAVAHTYEPAPSRVHVTGKLTDKSGSVTTVEVTFNDVPGDFNHDGFIDNADFEHFEACATEGSLPQAYAPCSDADLNGDGEVNRSDFGLFQRCYTGPGRLADPACVK